MIKILLIEPDRFLAEIYAQYLNDHGYKIIVCAGAQQAILAADKALPDLVILELQLVEHSGIEFLYEFRSYPEWLSIPVIIHSQVPVSEFDTSRQLLDGQLNVKNYLYKPHNSLHDLLTAIRDLVPVTA
ncbi:MAG TPA: response regulator [Candidatus Saccharimonadales bacterium]|nr:response regulator [Candidatus Saccharimonadales bacterium]